MKYYILIAPLLMLSFCVSSPEMKFQAISVKKNNIKYKLIKRNIEGNDCRIFSFLYYGSYENAANDALEKAPGANALINANFSKSEYPIGSICVKVKGDAVKI